MITDNQKQTNALMYVVALGGNIGNVELRFMKSLDLISQKIGEIENFSQIYLSKPLPTSDGISQERYLNSVVLLKSEKMPAEVMKILIEIEEELGRDRNLSNNWGPRTIDLDIISASGLVIKEKNLTIPHPRMYERDFVLLPLNDICPNWICPLSNRFIKNIISNMPEKFIFIEK